MKRGTEFWIFLIIGLITGYNLIKENLPDILSDFTISWNSFPTIIQLILLILVFYLILRKK